MFGFAEREVWLLAYNNMLHHYTYSDAMGRPVGVPVEGGEKSTCCCMCCVIHVNNVMDLVLGFAKKKNVVVIGVPQYAASSTLLLLYVEIPSEEYSNRIPLPMVYSTDACVCVLSL